MPVSEHRRICIDKNMHQKVHLYSTSLMDAPEEYAKSCFLKHIGWEPRVGKLKTLKSNI